MATSSDQAENPRAVAGDNNPPSMMEILAAKFAARLTETEALATKANALPKALASDDDLVPFVEVVKGARTLLVALDKERKAETDELRKQTAVTNAFFATKMVDRLTRIKAVLEERIGDYNEAKEEARRREMAKAAEEAEREASNRIAEAAQAEGSIESEVVQQAADKAVDKATDLKEAALGAQSPDLVRTRTEAGTVSSTGKWTYEIDDISKIPLAQLRQFIKTEHIEAALAKYASHFEDKKPLAGVRFMKKNRALIR
jgi:hypothetical protein